MPDIEIVSDLINCVLSLGFSQKPPRDFRLTGIEFASSQTT